jgi:hypothetical protein
MNKRLWLSVIAALTAGTIGTAAHSTVYDSSLASPGVYFGAGNEGTNTGWTVNTIGNVELGLTTIQRGVGAVSPTATNIYNVPLGSDSANAARAWWNFDFSINLQAGGGSLTLGDVTSTLTIYDYVHGTSVTLNPFTAFGDNSAYDGSTTRNGNVTGQQATAADVGMQNSENLTFSDFSALGFDMDVNDTYQIVLSLADANGTSIGSVNEFVVAGTGGGVAITPIPGALPLFASGLGALGLFGASRKRKRKVAA